jgi:adenylate cyclase class 2
MSDPSSTETELKIPVADLPAVRHRLAEANARRIHPAEREVNLVFDSSDGRISRGECLLRLRRIGDSRRLTFKGPPRFEGRIKHREELEVEVSDIDLVTAILQRLGYTPVLRYEKDRETWDAGGVTVTLDHTPMGDFVELEGPSTRLVETAESIRIDVADAVEGSYIALWQEHRNRHPDRDLPQDMVFAP